MLQVQVVISNEAFNEFMLSEYKYESTRTFYSFEDKFRKAKADVRRQIVEEVKAYHKEDQARKCLASVLLMLDQSTPHCQSRQMVTEGKYHLDTVTVKITDMSKPV